MAKNKSKNTVKSKKKGTAAKGNLGKAESAGEYTGWSDLVDYGVLLVGVYASDKSVQTKHGLVENPIHADVVVFDPEDRKPFKVYRNNNFFEGLLAKKILNDAEDDLGGSMGVVTEVDLGSKQTTYSLEEAPKGLRKAIEAFYQSDAVVPGPHGFAIDKKVAKKINNKGF